MSDWWADAVGYEVYLPSFCDSDGDGWGDLPGVIGKLDYLQWLGVDLLWLTPFYVSPMHDHGYDIADHRAVDPRFGTLDDLDRLVAEAHARGIRVISDLVVNHTSHEHPWFRMSKADKDNPYRDHYLWRPGRGPGQPPNNWVATFGGPAWTHDPGTDEWYAHLFTPEQPDLDWGNPKIADEVEAIMRFWLDRGLDGFRVDTAHYLAKHPDLPDNPRLPDDRVRLIGGAVADWYRYDHRHDIGQPALHDIHRRWRMIADDYGAFLVGETHMVDPSALADYLTGRDGLHSYFYFGLIQSTVDSGTEADLLRAATTASPALSWAQSSHDWSRAATRYGAARSLALTTLTMGLPGTPFLYQGDELGLVNGVVPAEQAQDPLAKRGGNHEHNRDASRTPMPWCASENLGFTSAATAWLPFGDRTPADTVEVQQQDPRSILHAHRRLLHVRRELPDLRRTEPTWLDTAPGMTAYRCGNTVVAANLGTTAAELDLDSSWRVRYSTVDRTSLGPLAPNEAVIVECAPRPSQPAS
ncbi:alpha-amylase family glycosyl hydrolase [Allokutzneria sp. A3M-2-11 16]|uniref:alpha-amylase family glycosyl hydrolase n=1 Tax=Allokutzneria sp. A3M-2-11 16 TaxID=2962043 RepID=UPI0020B90026|nr:alpha-amylase family glycosyl hydrolase [Allokutzneria sp. A3M-2-11 16]MCP3804710.1 alpha-amylase family glycosyl hydrolase [Allokutzneria sp. A3M-2-11 16]